MIRLRTPHGTGVALSTQVAVDDGARVALLHEPGRFRVDVTVEEDTLRTRIRDLAGAGIAYDDAGTPIPRIATAPLPGDARPVQLRVAFTLQTTPALEVVALIAAVRDPADGRTDLTGQAQLTPPVSP